MDFRLLFQNGLFEWTQISNFSQLFVQAHSNRNHRRTKLAYPVNKTNFK